MLVQVVKLCPRSGWVANLRAHLGWVVNMHVRLGCMRVHECPQGILWTGKNVILHKGLFLTLCHGCCSLVIFAC